MIRVCADARVLSFAAAELFAAALRKAVKARCRFVVALAGTR
jgi:6-phosphogluconolactonase/glucosamine-6-phosphate isomerase/deaminase